ncbi:MAG: hypothetical protein JWO50_461 [Candidatus Kaiserbacteria bacterium]|nr:hypothetical protein [Candidatus Kaiserbacteria bacterium]
METFSAAGSITFGWELFKKRAWFFIGVEVLVFIASYLFSYVSGLLHNGALSFIVNFLLSNLLYVGYTAFVLKAHDAVETVTLESFWNPRQYWQYLVVSILTSLAIIGGCILLIVPGIILGLMFLFATYIVVDKNIENPITAIKESVRITNGHKWQLFIFALLAIGVYILGAIALGVGLLVAVPVVSFATAHAYRTLGHQATETVAQPVSPITVPFVPSV